MYICPQQYPTLSTTLTLFILYIWFCILHRNVVYLHNVADHDLQKYKQPVGKIDKNCTQKLLLFIKKSSWKNV